MRESEPRGLSWINVDFDAGMVLDRERADETCSAFHPLGYLQASCRRSGRIRREMSGCGCGFTVGLTDWKRAKPMCQERTLGVEALWMLHRGRSAMLHRRETGTHHYGKRPFGPALRFCVR